MKTTATPRRRTRRIRGGRHRGDHKVSECHSPPHQGDSVDSGDGRLLAMGDHATRTRTSGRRIFQRAKLLRRFEVAGAPYQQTSKPAIADEIPVKALCFRIGGKLPARKRTP
jgi:hypothetical protein